MAPGDDAVIGVETHGEVTFVRLARRVLGWPVYWTGCYLVDGLLLDCGPPATVAELLDFLAGRRVVGLAITHHHEDHMGAAYELGTRLGLAARIHPAGLGFLERGFEQQFYRRLAWGRASRVPARPLGPSFEGERLRFEMIETPGHSPDHACFLVRERGWLFTGDLFIAERLRFLRADEDLTQLIASLELAASLPVDAVFCAHRGLVRDGVGALRRKAGHLGALREAIRDGLRRGRSEAEVARHVVGREGLFSYLSLGHFSARNFVRAVASSLPGR
jgi:glyoxylase-like metal-dependent hydrolase (beta-lactamase superfamily II)